VVLDRSPDNIDRFFRKHAARKLESADQVSALKLLELQRHAMLMYTSCGWFFDELSGIETVQCIQYAGRVVALAQQLFREDIEPAFLAKLSQAKSNIPEFSDGAQIYHKWVRPAVIDLPEVAAHYAIASVFEPSPELNRIYCYNVEREDSTDQEREGRKLAIGRVRISSAIIWESAMLIFAALHLGNQQIRVSVWKPSEDPHYLALVKELRSAFCNTGASEIAVLFDEAFGENTHSLRSQKSCASC
jgi:hypothetical protein